MSSRIGGYMAPFRLLILACDIGLFQKQISASHVYLFFLVFFFFRSNHGRQSVPSFKFKCINRNAFFSFLVHTCIIFLLINRNNNFKKIIQTVFSFSSSRLLILQHNRKENKQDKQVFCFHVQPLEKIIINNIYQ